MTDYSKFKRYDIAITDPSTSNVFGFDVFRDKNGLPFWNEMDGKALVDLFSGDSPTQTSTNPEEELPLGQSDWIAGFGQEKQDLSRTKRYHKSYGFDLRFKGKGVLGWNSTAATIPSLLAITDASLEAWTGSTLDNWTYSETDVDWAMTDETVEVYAGSHSAKIAGGNVTQNTYAQILQEAITWNNNFRGCTFTISCRIKCTSIAKMKGQLIIDDGIGTTTVNSTADGSWELVTCTRKLDAAATKLEVIIRVIAVVTDVAGDYPVYLDDVDFPAVGVKGIDFEDFDSDMFIADGECLLRVNNTTGAITYQGCFLHTITALIKFQVSGTDYLFIFFGTSNNYWYMTTAEVFTESTATDKTYQFGAWVNTTVDTLYANDGNNTIRSTVNPLNGGTAWSAQTIVGAAENAVTHMQEKDGALLVDKEDMPYYLDSSGNVQKDLAPEAISGKSSHSGKNSTIWLGEYFRATGDQALLRVGTSNSWINPSKYGTDIGNFSGQVEAVAGDEEWLYTITDDGDYIIVFAGREETIGHYTGSDYYEITDWVWHPIHRLALTGCETCWISTVYQKRLWISSTSSSDDLYYLPLPTEYGDITNDDNRTFKTGGYFETEWLHGGFPTDNKANIDLTLIMGHTYDANVYFNVYYKLLGGSWSSAVKFDGSASTMIDTQYLAAASTSRTSPWIKLKFEGVTDDTDLTPILLDYKLGSILYPDTKKIILTKVRLGEDTVGTVGKKPALYTLRKACLSNVRAATSWVTFKHYFDSFSGTSLTVKQLPLPQSPDWAWRKPVRWEKEKVVEWEYTLLLMVVNTS